MRDVYKRFGGILAVNGAALEVEEGSVTALIGPNGAGKTTLFNVIDNMMLAAANQPGESLVGLIVRAGAARRREREVRERAHELLEIFQLERLANEYAGVLSGGQRKLLEFARALMAEPTMLLLDEPMAGINPTLGARLLEHMHQLRDDRGMTFLFVEHDMEVVMGHSDRVIVMAEGRVIATGPPAEVRRDKRVIDAYLGGGAAVGAG